MASATKANASHLSFRWLRDAQKLHLSPRFAAATRQSAWVVSPCLPSRPLVASPGGNHASLRFESCIEDTSLSMLSDGLARDELCYPPRLLTVFSSLGSSIVTLKASPLVENGSPVLRSVLRSLSEQKVTCISPPRIRAQRFTKANQHHKAVQQEWLLFRRRQEAGFAA